LRNWSTLLHLCPIPPYNNKVFKRTPQMTDEQRTDIIEYQMEHIYALCEAFAEADEEDNCRALYEEYEEWIHAENEEDGEYVVMWAPNFSLSN